MQPHDIHQLPAGLPAPVDDGACDHLPGMHLPSILLPATDGSEVDLAGLPGLIAVFTYPRTGVPGQLPLVQDWDLIPGARGCTPQTCRFRDLHAEFARLGCRVFGLSTQDTAYQREMVTRLHVPFSILSDDHLRLIGALRLPTFTVASQILVRRLAWVANNGIIRKVFYPAFPPDRHADQVLAWLQPKYA